MPFHDRGSVHRFAATVVVFLSIFRSFAIANHGQTRRLHQEGAQYGLNKEKSNAAYFNLTLSEGVAAIGSWEGNPAFSIQCPSENGGSYWVGPENPVLCTDGAEATMSSSLFGNITVEFNKTDLETFRSINIYKPNEYVYALPLNKYAAPNALYESLRVDFLIPGGSFAYSGDNKVLNPFNATASSLRDYYGVEESLQGSQDTVQLSMMPFAYDDTGVNATAVSEYLEIQGLVPNIPLQFSEWAPPNNVSKCFLPGQSAFDLCGEQMLDTEAQQAFAPQAVTVYIPTEDIADNITDKTFDQSVAVKYLVLAGYSESEAQDLVKNGDRSDQTVQTAFNKGLEQYVLEFFQNVTDSDPRAQVVSLSWTTFGYTEFSSFEVLEEAMKKWALRGTTILVSSGDSGASAEPTGCLNSTNPLMGNKEGDAWPVVSPWVTAVGGTQILATKDNPEGTEVVCSTITDGGITSGGGFAGSEFPSKLYGRPAWQEKAVQGYLSANNASSFDGFPTLDTPGYNPFGRAFPDISMYASNFPTLQAGGNLTSVSGTSLAAPIAAAVFSLANQKLMEDGYDIIGYANPMLYWMGENCTDAFNDITVGDNKAGQDGEYCSLGFPAAPGWDAATGFGSINFEPFVECTKRYQDEVRSKGLEILPDGTFNVAAASSNASGNENPGSSVTGFDVVIPVIVSIILGVMLGDARF